MLEKAEYDASIASLTEVVGTNDQALGILKSIADDLDEKTQAIASVPTPPEGYDTWTEALAASQKEAADIRKQYIERFMTSTEPPKSEPEPDDKPLEYDSLFSKI